MNPETLPYLVAAWAIGSFAIGFYRAWRADKSVQQAMKTFTLQVDETARALAKSRTDFCMRLEWSGDYQQKIVLRMHNMPKLEEVEVAAEAAKDAEIKAKITNAALADQARREEQLREGQF